MGRFLLVLAAAALLASAPVMAGKPPPPPSTPPPSPPGQQCSDSDPACLPGSIFKCGQPELSTLVCRAGAAACRVIMDPLTPNAGTGFCDGDLVSVAVNPADDLISLVASPGVISGPVRVESINKKSSCTEDFSKPIRAPKNCGSGDKQCGVAFVDLCYCSGKAGPPTLSTADMSDRESLVCKPLAFTPISAVNTCGQPIDVTVTIVTPESDLVATLGKGATEIPAGTFPGCGDYHVYFTSINPRNELSSQVGFLVNAHDELVHPPVLPGGLAVCSKTFETKCGGGAKAVPPSSLLMAGCTLKASFPAQSDVCGASYPIADAELEIGGCGVGGPALRK